MVRCHDLANGLADHSRDSVAGTDSHEEQIAESKASRQAKERSRQPIERHAAEQHQPLLIDIFAQRNDGAGYQRTYGVSRRQEAIALRAHVEHLAGHEGQHGARRTEKGGEEVEQHTAPDDARAAHKAPSLDNGLPVQASIDRRPRPPIAQHSQGQDDGPKGNGVDRINPPHSKPADDQPSERRPRDRGGL